MEQFRFESLLKLRESERDEKKLALVAFQKSLDQASERLASLEAQIKESLAQSRSVRTQATVTAQVLRNRQASHNALLQRRKEALRELQLLQEEFHAKCEELTEVSKEVKALTTLKEKEEARRQEALLKRANKELDDYSIQSHTQKRQTEN
ncbi:MAG: flagellar export protein FliJ [Planctomycetia bacterium]|nr:flagellar export protein FliJ [Planctomycetia bacterium]